MTPRWLAAGGAALAVAIVGVALAARLLRTTPLPAASTPLPATPAPAGFPAPPAGAVVFAREDGPDALALAVVPGGATMLVQASVVGQQANGVRGLEVEIGSARAAACGAGCYSASVPVARSVDLRVRGGAATTRWTVALPTPWPPAGAEALVARAARTWRSLSSLAFFDRLASDPLHAVVSTWRAVAPDRLEYRVKGGYDAVIVGGRRWDRAPGGRWVESAQVPLRQPLPVWQSATDAYVVGSSGSAWRISFYDPRTPAWFEIAVDKRTFHTLDLRMTTTAHFMHETYGSFDAAGSIAPPTSR